MRVGSGFRAGIWTPRFYMENKRKCPIHRFPTIYMWNGGLLQCSKCGGYVEPLKDFLAGQLVQINRVPNSIHYETN
jgi:hypothetical protein